MEVVIKKGNKQSLKSYKEKEVVTKKEMSKLSLKMKQLFMELFLEWSMDNLMKDSKKSHI